MKEYIDKAEVIAELERLITELVEEGEDTMFEQGRISAFEDVKVFINHTLEAKEVDLDDEKDTYICNHFSEGSDGGMISDAYGEIGGVTYFDLSNIAEHFYELGLKTKGE